MINVASPTREDEAGVYSQPQHSRDFPHSRLKCLVKRITHHPSGLAVPTNFRVSVRLLIPWTNLWTIKQMEHLIATDMADRTGTRPNTDRLRRVRCSVHCSHHWSNVGMQRTIPNVTVGHET